MGLYVSTTGTSVAIPELGITIVHPVTDQDISGQFSSDDVERASSLTTAIQSGVLVWRKVAAGAIQPAADYDQNFLEVDEENTGSGLQADRTVTFKDLTGATTKMKSGTVVAASFTGNPKKATITFATAFPSTAYNINLSATDARMWTIESQLVGSFVINANANQALTGNVFWQAQVNGEVG